MEVVNAGLPPSVRQALANTARNDARPVTAHAGLERMRSTALDYLNAAQLQLRRLSESTSDNEPNLPWRYEWDFQWLVVPLTRLRRAIRLARKFTADDLDTALSDFDARVPDLIAMRNVAEHFDDYTSPDTAKRDRRTVKDVRRSQLENWSMDLAESGPAWSWLGRELNAATALEAAYDLYAALRSARPLE